MRPPLCSPAGARAHWPAHATLPRMAPGNGSRALWSALPRMAARSASSGARQVRLHALPAAQFESCSAPKRQRWRAVSACPHGLQEPSRQCPASTSCLAGRMRRPWGSSRQRPTSTRRVPPKATYILPIIAYKIRLIWVKHRKSDDPWCSLHLQAQANACTALSTPGAVVAAATD
jgi:hypothetical protein